MAEGTRMELTGAVHRQVVRPAMMRLRQKLRAHRVSLTIESVPGYGYRLNKSLAPKLQGVGDSVSE